MKRHVKDVHVARAARTPHGARQADTWHNARARTQRGDGGRRKACGGRLRTNQKEVLFWLWAVARTAIALRDRPAR